jgi:hypothetical protein
MTAPALEYVGRPRNHEDALYAGPPLAAGARDNVSGIVADVTAG